MNTSSDTYKTLVHPSEAVSYKSTKSKFYGYAYPLGDEACVKPIIKALKKNIVLPTMFAMLGS